ncbi:MAG TPA: KpsF/GutQ family sugar-phosphate isomerase [Planctomycetota bacterium]|nr:KpsF/GutQ family sugar-phosphate isomerase [Planctomycetota bacterium]
MSDDARKDVRDGRKVIHDEIRALRHLAGRLGREFSQALERILACEGHVVVTGMGKAGIIGQKVSATLASTGTPSHFMHPAEALHGDLGRIVAGDVVLAFSNSGETDEIVRLLPAIRKIGAKLISITAGTKSTLAAHSDVTLPLGTHVEAGPLGLAPSASTAAMLALGDALALTLVRRRGFDKEKFAFYHPGGSLGRHLLKVEEILRPLRDVATVPVGATVREAVRAISAGKVHRSGAACVVGRTGILKGILTDGDIRRRLAEGPGFLDKRVDDVMTKTPITVRKGSLAADAFKVLKSRRIDELPVVDRRGRLSGLVDVQDLLDTLMV